MPRKKTTNHTAEPDYDNLDWDAITRDFARTNVAPNENPASLTMSLVNFYAAYPEHETDINTIFLLLRTATKELEKFIGRPHKQVTEIFF